MHECLVACINVVAAIAKCCLCISVGDVFFLEPSAIIQIMVCDDFGLDLLKVVVTRYKT